MSFSLVSFCFITTVGSQSKHLTAELTAESESMGQKLQLDFRKGTSNHDLINAFGYVSMITIKLVAAKQFK
jgi:hypothetical protein